MKAMIAFNIIILLIAVFIAVVALSGTFSGTSNTETRGSFVPNSPPSTAPTKCCLNVLSRKCFPAPCFGDNEYEIKCGSSFCK